MLTKFVFISEVKKRSISPEMSNGKPSDSAKISSLLSRLLHTTENKSHKLKEEPQQILYDEDKRKPTNRLPPLVINKSYLIRSNTPDIILPDAQYY